MQNKWFKNLQIYCFRHPVTLSATMLQEKLTQSTFHPAGQLQWSSMGWVPPSEDSEALVFPVQQSLFIKARKQDKILPTSVIRDFVQERIEHLESEQLRKVGKREKSEIKDQIIAELLPRALPRNNEITAYIDIKNGWFIINTSNRKKAEEVISLLRMDVGDLALVLPELNASPMRSMTQWLITRDLPSQFDLGEDCKLIAEEGESVTCKQLDLLSKEVMEHLNAGKSVQYLALQWQNKLAFVLDDEFSVRRVEFLEISEEPSDDMYANLALMTVVFAQFIPQLFDAFGGLATAPAS
jgi:recombination associated protein RdgC